MGIEEDKPVMFLNCSTEAASYFLLGLKLTLAELLSVLSTQGKSRFVGVFFMLVKSAFGRILGGRFKGF